ncbi:hypothetical protein HDC94_000986 [Leifsonia sp. AK011]|uniref:HNH endonuclease signature motif containing protein n=1 Tax=Leifsonia sp. AK011 TaxID=2723075 RepID=UPI0015C9C6D4|nr:HNH endonuclease signature motif containing protein [Leifsonia sp. AK011]NYF09830.1 hypothetical protein [Leifsonia sp. AK011]
MPTTSTAAPSVVTLPAVEGIAHVTDERLLELERQATAARRQVDAVTIAITSEIVRRSDSSLGHAGLSARLGAASPEKAIQALTGVSFAEARALATVATSVGDDSPWLSPVRSGVADGSLSVASAAAIATGLGTPDADVAADDLLDAADQLVDLAATATPESVGKSARILREQLAAANIADLEAHRRSRRSLTWHQQPDGMTRLNALLDPESAAVITGAIDTVLSPRRGGPRFVDPDEQERADELVADTRTTPQLAVDTLVDIVELAVRASGTDIDPASLFGTRSPAVRVHVPLEALETGEGAGYFEGQTALVSAETAARHVCVSGIIPILFAGAKAIDVGNTHRLHSARQRVALAAQWNGCPMPGCDRPPSMTEIHHPEPWNGHNTTLKNAIPFCKFHHVEIHANHWTIERRGSEYWLVPPPDHPGKADPQRLVPRSLI